MADAPGGDGTRARLLQATLRAVERAGLTGTTVEDVATAAGVSRATVYRHFPGGRDQLIHDAVAAEVQRFFTGLGEALPEEPDVASHLRIGLLVGHRAVHEHALLQQVLRTEPEALLRELAEAAPLVHRAVVAHVRSLLELESLRPGVDPDEAADYIARLFLSYLGTQGRWDLSDEREVERLVRTQLLAGVLA